MARPKLDRVPFNITLPRELVERWRDFCASRQPPSALNIAVESALKDYMGRFAMIECTEKHKKKARTKKPAEVSETLSKSLKILMGDKQ